MARKKKTKKAKQGQQAEDEKNFKATNDVFTSVAQQMKDQLYEMHDNAFQAELNQGKKTSDFFDYCTNVTMNASDPYGDGDQSPVRADFPTDPGQRLRDVWANQCDLVPLVMRGKLPTFFMQCFVGQASEVEAVIDNTKENSDERLHLLEERISNCRLSPLMVCICGARNAGRPGGTPMPAGADYLRTAEILCAAGARVDAKDLAGYTPAYHCTTSSGSDATFSIFRMLVDKYDADPNAYNRFGCFALLEACMSFRPELVQVLVQNGANPAKSDRNHAHITPVRTARAWPEAQAMMSQATLPHRLTKFKEGDRCRLDFLVKRSDLNGQEGNLGPQNYLNGRWLVNLDSDEKVMVTRQNLVPVSMCANCGKQASKKCSLCHQVWYCSRDCQRVHWKKSHKTNCPGNIKSTEASVVLEMKNRAGGPKLNSYFDQPVSISYAQGKKHIEPKEQVTKGEIQKDGSLLFPIKIQASLETAPNLVDLDEKGAMLVYNKDRSFRGFITNTNPMHGAVVKLIKKTENPLKMYLNAKYKADEDTIFVELAMKNVLPPLDF